MNDHELESALQRALRPDEPPKHFAQAVMNRVRPAGLSRQWAWALAAGMALLFFGFRHFHAERQKAEAKEQLLAALRLTGRELHRGFSVIAATEAQKGEFP